MYGSSRNTYPSRTKEGYSEEMIPNPIMIPDHLQNGKVGEISLKDYNLELIRENERLEINQVMH